ncbi:hypothetical protein ADUPG1_008022 [Aduncisulcus paluster]|uniref:Trichohyalin-plectin-homology domain-containing protein n=1 Tax=Aduncisulcus paluster TaxID=2918883 RepID=A0ABQ5KSZ3_9EUKA|nr:hypothetical protein ADUPG1_008022 [Aduncisulcus paluster]|eukprot:gnl/Carplike_NY0171/8643_a12003_211.p1 GENE.gnl/Carplike_NY0171/8643_a12003_211~~gnl/Carplike_NY0171/8643_a12003_211.p1  ORF type:complete len:389 (+),score=137.65 gnl/Carplike_NY0171/8643_a12003_211:1-1167(+)
MPQTISPFISSTHMAYMTPQQRSSILSSARSGQFSKGTPSRSRPASRAYREFLATRKDRLLCDLCVNSDLMRRHAELKRKQMEADKKMMERLKKEDEQKQKEEDELMRSIRAKNKQFTDDAMELAKKQRKEEAEARKREIEAEKAALARDADLSKRLFLQREKEKQLLKSMQLDDIAREKAQRQKQKELDEQVPDLFAPKFEDPTIDSAKVQEEKKGYARLLQQQIERRKHDAVERRKQEKDKALKEAKRMEEQHRRQMEARLMQRQRQKEDAIKCMREEKARKRALKEEERDQDLRQLKDQKDREAVEMETEKAMREKAMQDAKATTDFYAQQMKERKQMQELQDLFDNALMDAAAPVIEECKESCGRCGRLVDPSQLTIMPENGTE